MHEQRACGPDDARRSITRWVQEARGTFKRETWCPEFSTNQMVFGSWTTMPEGLLAGVGIASSRKSPSGVNRVIRLAVSANSVNQMSPVEDAAIAHGTAFGVGTANSVIAPSAEI